MRGSEKAAEVLLEREGDLARIESLMEAACADDGSVLIVDGPAGIGKTALLQAAVRMAARSGMSVLNAVGSELERDFSYGIVRQLLEPPVRAATAARRRKLLGGQAELAALAVGSPEARAGGRAVPEQTFAVLHGLYWLTANLAAERPIVISIDDAHWSDPPSLRFVSHLVHRLEGLPILVVLAGRPDASSKSSAVLAHVISSDRCQVLHPAPLSPGAIRELTRLRLSDDPDERFVEACLVATGGIPYFVRALLNSLADEGHAPVGSALAHLEDEAPSAVGQAMLLRFARLPPTALAVAQAVAVLARLADARRVAAVAGTEHGPALESIDALVEAGMLAASGPLRFVHPIVRSVVYGEMPRGRRSHAHASAARLLAAEGAGPEDVAAHLLLTEPAGERSTIDALRAAATAALQRGAPESAVAYLTRAVPEAAVSTTRGMLMHELGRAKALLRDPGAVSDLYEALRITEDPVASARITRDLAPILVFSGLWGEAIPILDIALERLAGHSPDLQPELEALRTAIRVYDPAGQEQLECDLPRLRAIAHDGGAGGRSLALLLAGTVALRGESSREVRALIDRGLDGGRLIQEEGAEQWSLPQGFGALVFIDELDKADRLAQQMIDDARRRGSVLGFIFGVGHRGLSETRRGNLLSAEADLRAVLELAEEHELGMAVAVAPWYFADAILERPQLDDIATMLRQHIEVPSALAGTITDAWLREVRGRLQLAQGDRAAAAEQLEQVYEIYTGTRVSNPNVSAVRSTLALALVSSDRARAGELIDEELELARAASVPRALGIALRAAGLIEGGERGIALLWESLEALRRAPAVLERARTQVELGAALRRANQPTAGREALTAGLDIAHRCGADRLASRAEEELLATGYRRPKRPVSGVNALTPSEARIARMAADGLSNRDIAQALFITAKSVENVLGRAYGKLGVHSRAELRSALAADPPTGDDSVPETVA